VLKPQTSRLPARLSATRTFGHRTSGQWLPGGAGDIERALRDVATSVDWKVAHGWERPRAEAYTLIASIFKAALAHALRARLASFAASTYVLCETLSYQAWQQPAPPRWLSVPCVAARAA